ncbi:hypothetical protein [Pseudomonas syringae]|uniref:hypothetical protein n=1 Tax=Pseudomonas syringae TaxID=317 RepID=UPI001F0D752D|nr:hypothetical protein [Pseudomonas syringae]MCH5583099.1 hypothetical protein [Pseudomonas syringae pv. syringae]MCH5592802.1 hypothetical protein [Pseudomonas syringae pv. syringae]MDF5791053.1 hypothetical protein [Pseudomonas syringae pv. syringae]
MHVKLSPQRRDDLLSIRLRSDTLIINGEAFDFSPLTEGSTIPATAVDTQWLVGDIERTGLDLYINVLFPIPANYTEDQAFPSPLEVQSDGPVQMPGVEYLEVPEFGAGRIDWTQVDTKEEKETRAQAAVLARAQSTLNSLIRQANAQVLAISGRITTLDYLINQQDPGDEDYLEPKQDEVNELPVRKLQLDSWNKYNIKLGRVKTQSVWPSAPVWPAMPEPYTSETASVEAPAV